jgi:thioredoxin 1
MASMPTGPRTTLRGVSRGVVLALVAVALATVVVAVRGGSATGRALAANGPTTTPALPRLVDLGAKTCIPCKAMAPILEGLRSEYAGRMDVLFIDVWKDRGAADAYAIRIIPTQVFFGADGRELARHEGFMGKEEILAQWKAVGVVFKAP